MTLFARLPFARSAAVPSPPRSRRSRWRVVVLRRLLAAVLLSTAAVGIVRICAPPPPLTSTVIVAARDLPSGTIISPADLATQRVAGTPVGPVLARPADALGRRVAGPIARGEAVTATRFVPRSVADGLAADLTAVHLTVVDERSLELAAPGAHVDVHDLDGQLLATNVRILSLDAPAPPEPGIAHAGVRLSGLVVALPRTLVPTVLAGKGLSPEPPMVHLVLGPGSS